MLRDTTALASCIIKGEALLRRVARAMRSSKATISTRGTRDGEPNH